MNMTDLDQLNSLLKNFEEVIASPSNNGIGELILNAMQTLDLKPSQLANALEVSGASVSRWTSGGNAPHPRHLRALQEMVRLKMLQLSEPEGFEFHGRKVGIWSFDTFFRRAREARAVYVLKNLLGFQAGTNPLIKQQLKDLFTSNSELRICYGYPRDSEAAMTFLNFRKELAGEWPRNIFWKELPAEHEIMQMLGGVFASPFIIEQHDGRVDILLEVPVKVIRAVDEFDLAGYTSLFLELSDTHKHRMWLQWRPLLEKIEWESTPIKIRVIRSCTAPIIEVRDVAYELGSSGADNFDSQSFFVTAEIEGKVVGSIRLTDSEKASPLRQWAQGKSPLPHGKGVVELTRGVVYPSKRNLGIYKWMMLRAVREAAEIGFLKATAAVEQDYYLKDFLRQLGFKEIGKVLPYDDEPRKDTLCQSMVCDLRENQARWSSLEKELDERRRQKGVVILNERQSA
jgi:predicted GNAT family N-acyltransferase